MTVDGIRQAVANKERKARCVEYLGGKCIDCGLIAHECNLTVFEFDHRDPSTKGYRNNWGEARHWPWERLQAELDKCDLRCANCHRIRTFELCDKNERKVLEALSLLGRIHKAIQAIRDIFVRSK